MANELVIHHPTGATLYALLFDATGQIYNGAAFAAPGSASWTDYDIAMTEAATATGIYRASMPAVAAGAYGWTVRKQAGANPAVSDITVGAGSIRWTGTAEEAVPPAVNVTMQQGVAVAAADANGNVPVVLYGTQGAVTFGQVKIVASTANYEGALDIRNNAASGYGTYIQGLQAGAYTSGGLYGQINAGSEVGLVNGGAKDVSGVDSQGIRNAMKLAPSAGAPAAGSVDAKLDDLLTAGDPWSTALPGAYGAGTAGALLAGIDGNVDLLLAADTSTSDATTAGSISRRRGNSWAIPLTIGAITGYTSLWFSIKSSYDDADTAALLQIKLNASGLSDGLLYVNGTTASSDALGSITVNNATTGAIVIAVDETITDDLAPGEYCYDVQTLIAGDVATPDSGTFTVTADVTRSVT